MATNSYDMIAKDTTDIDAKHYCGEQLTKKLFMMTVLHTFILHSTVFADIIHNYVVGM